MTCDFSKPWFGRSEPDSVCIEGYLQDKFDPRGRTDCRLHPCPRCNTRAFLLHMRDEHDRTAHLEGGPHARAVVWTSANMWRFATDLARRENPNDADAMIAEIEREDGSGR